MVCGDCPPHPAPIVLAPRAVAAWADTAASPTELRRRLGPVFSGACRSLPDRVADAARIPETSTVRLRKDEKVELLRKVPLFAQVSRRELARVASIATEVEYGQGVTLLREGSHDDGFFILLQGEVDVRRRARLLRTLKRGDFFGEIGLVASAPRTASVMTGTPVEALLVSGKDFKRVLSQSPTLALKVLEALGNRLNTTALTD